MSGKIKVVLLMGVMFGLGTISGSAWQSYRNHHFFPPRMAYAERRVKRMTSQLHLSSSQEQTLREIFQKAHERATQVNEEVSWDLADIHRDSVQAIRALLTPEQRVEFEKLHSDYHARYQHMPDDDIETSSTSPKANS
jgi:Spy/CpxP family protein refolding chaperone